MRSIASEVKSQAARGQMSAATGFFLLAIICLLSAILARHNQNLEITQVSFTWETYKYGFIRFANAYYPSSEE